MWILRQERLQKLLREDYDGELPVVSCDFIYNLKIYLQWNLEHKPDYVLRMFSHDTVQLDHAYQGLELQAAMEVNSVCHLIPCRVMQWCSLPTNLA